MEFEIEGKTVVTDSEGYLTDLSQWTPELASRIAEKEGLSLSDSHWEVINFLRDGYRDTGSVPNMRQLTKAFSKVYGPEKGDSKYLYGLFPYGPAKQGCRMGGLPKPTGCV
jgi:TusE/DsrC/DsvC family sulfur relay protein